MGGCRCTYRNCTVRSNGITHMFHYPVFDKVRCHQWLTNANRLDFLNLKVSQLKNRVICQHHFEEHWFMNFKKEKLKFEAVPTLDGPYCASKVEKTFPTSDKILSITLDDIENEFLTFSDKRANFSVKYVDFLTNNELEDVDLSNNNKQKQIIISESVNKQTDSGNSPRKLRSSKNKTQNQESKNTDSSKENLKVTLLNSPITLNVEYEAHGNGKENSIVVENIAEKIIKKDSLHELSMPSISVDTNPKEIMTSSHNHNIQQNNASISMPLLELEAPSTLLQIKSENVISNTKKNNSIQILEEQKISSYIPIPKSLQPLSPSGVLRLPTRKTMDNVNNKDKKDSSIKITDITASVTDNCIDLPPNTESNCNINIYPNIDIAPGIYHVPVSFPSEQKEEMITLTDLTKQNEITKDIQPTESKMITKPSNKSLLKNKINAEQLATIKEKRKFNMKLRDVIESCLDSKDNNNSGFVNREEDHNKIVNTSNKRIRNNLEKVENLKKANINKLKNMSVTKSLSKDPHLPSVGEYSIAYLEARMKRMEDILLNKIDQNSQRIVELKNTMGKTQMKTVQTQTTHTEETYKIFLYNEISKYLNPDASSLIYEQLFVNSSVEKSSKVTPSPKKRRKR